MPFPDWQPNIRYWLAVQAAQIPDPWPIADHRDDWWLEVFDAALILGLI